MDVQLLKYYKKKNMELEKTNNEYEKKLEDQYFEIQELQKELAELGEMYQRDLKENERKIKHLNQKLNDRNQLIEQLKEQMADRDSEKSRQQHAISRLNDHIQKIEQLNTTYQNNIKQLSEDNGVLMKQNTEMINREKDLKTEIHRLEGKYKQIANAHTRLKQENASLQHELEKALQERKELENSYQEKMKELIVLNNEQQRFYMSSIYELERQMNELLDDEELPKNQNDDRLENKDDFDKSQIELLLWELQHSEAKLSESEVMIHSLEQKVSLLTDELNDVKVKLKEYEQKTPKDTN